MDSTPHHNSKEAETPAEESSNHKTSTSSGADNTDPNITGAVEASNVDTDDNDNISKHQDNDSSNISNIGDATRDGSGGHGSRWPF